MKLYIYNLIFILISLTSCKQHSPPPNIKEAIKYFEKKLSEKEKTNFKSKTEQTAVSELHFTTGLWIRNNWIRGKNNELVKQFDSLGVRNPDDISSIILTSLHRKLNNKEIKLNEQTKYYREYWKKITEKENKSKEKAVNVYNNYKIGDEITIFYPVISNDGEKNAVIYEENEKWIFDSKRDLKLTGIITNKYFINSETNVFFELKITSLNHRDISVLGQKVEIGKTHDFNLDKLRIE